MINILALVSENLMDQTLPKFQDGKFVEGLDNLVYHFAVP